MPLIVTRMVIPTVLLIIPTVILGMVHLTILAAIVSLLACLTGIAGLGMALHADRMGA